MIYVHIIIYVYSICICMCMQYTSICICHSPHVSSLFSSILHVAVLLIMDIVDYITYIYINISFHYQAAGMAQGFGAHHRPKNAPVASLRQEAPKTPGKG